MFLAAVGLETAQHVTGESPAAEVAVEDGIAELAVIGKAQGGELLQEMRFHAFEIRVPADPRRKLGEELALGTGMQTAHRAAEDVTLDKAKDKAGVLHAPSRATLHRAMMETDPDALQGALSRWVKARTPERTALAADGKRIRGAKRHGERYYETVTLVTHEGAMPVASRVCHNQGGETAAVMALLEEVDVRGSVITLDALHTTRNTANTIVRSHGAHYLFTVKGNAPETFETLHSIEWERDADTIFSQHTDKPHGRIEQRHIQTLQPIPGLIKYPHVQQIFRVTRQRYTVTTGESSSEYAYGITSLSPDQAGPERLLALNRGHWTVENQNHRHRDTTFAEDACLMRTRHGPANNAVLNNMALAIIFHNGFTGVEAAVQHFAMGRDKAIRAITQPG